jgi:hypothetical protein
LSLVGGAPDLILLGTLFPVEALDGGLEGATFLDPLGERSRAIEKEDNNLVWNHTVPLVT